MRRPTTFYRPDTLQPGLDRFLKYILKNATDIRDINENNFISLSNDQTLTLTDSFQTIELRRMHLVGEQFTFNGIDNFITPDFEGSVEIHAQVSVDDTSGTSGAQTEARLTKNDSELTGSKMFIDHRGNSEGPKTAAASIIESVDANDEIRLTVKRAAGSDTLKTEADACRLLMRRLLT